MLIILFVQIIGWNSRLSNNLNSSLTQPVYMTLIQIKGFTKDF